MKQFAKSLILAVAAGATVLSAMPAANAGDWRYRDGYRHHHRDRGGDAALAGVLGLAVGAVAGAAIAAPRDRVIVYDEPRPVYRSRPVYVEPRPVYSRPQVVYNYGLEPWSREWYRYCSDRYRSFNPNDGTFVGYDGVRRFCSAD